MNYRSWLKKLVCYVLMLSMTLTFALPTDWARAADEPNGGQNDGQSVSFVQVSNDEVQTSLLPQPQDVATMESDMPNLAERVRVSIVLDDDGTIEAGYDIDSIAENSRAISYREKLRAMQNKMKRKIEDALGGSLNVKWNLTLAANLISAEIAYGQIDTIRALPGVKNVVIEQQYQPMALADNDVDIDDVASSKMAISTGMTGMQSAWQQGYTGAGSRVAIIDTGIDVDHQSFSGTALDYALEQNAKNAGVAEDTYLAGLNLLDAAKVDDVLLQLNVYNILSSVRGSDMYHSSKLPFAFNYVDHDYDHMGSPSSYTNALSVASVDNQGMISDAFLSFGDGDDKLVVGYNETLYNDMQAMTSLDTAETGGTEYDFVMVPGLGEESDYDGIDVEGKIAFVSRGVSTFYDKAGIAVQHGAIATVIYNNVDGSMGMDMTDYHESAPAVAITKADAAKIRARAQQMTSDIDEIYYGGKMRVNGTVSLVEGDKESFVMSCFSSWGSTGDLAMKPEITAPGGSICSVKGSEEATDKYKLNSGTSMATPQVAGVTAAVGQHIRANKLTEKFGHSNRQIAQSLLMATAVPLKDDNGNYYPLLQQGAGLVNGKGAVNAGAYIMMSEGATPSWADGKVKAELGDDPERTGVYEFGFTVYNTEAAAKSYNLSAELFVQAVAEYPSAPGSKINAEYQLKTTTPLASSAQFAANGSDLGGKLTVPANGSVTVADHSWGTPTYTWSKDHSSCTVAAMCACGEKLTEKAAADLSTTDSTCSQAGNRTYTATFTNAAFAIQTYVENLVLAVHDWVISGNSDAAGLVYTCTECGGTTTKTVDDSTPVFVVSNARGSVGEELQLTVSALNNPGIIAATLQLGYNTEELQMIRAENLSDLKSFSVSGNTIGLGGTNETANGALIRITFKALKDCDASVVSLGYKPADVYNYAMQNVEFAIDNGVITRAAIRWAMLTTTVL